MQKSASLHTNIHQQPPKPQLRLSKTLPPSGPSQSQGIRTATRTVTRTSAVNATRSISTSPRSYATSRTDSPSPQRIRRQPAANETQRQPKPPCPTQSKSKPQDSTPKKSKTPPSTSSQKAKKDPLETKTKTR